MSASASSSNAKADGLGVAALIAATATVFLICFAGRYGYMADELYFLACSEHPAWGYADLPPLLPWLTWLVTHTLGSSLVAVRLYPALACGASIWLAAKLAAELGGRRRAVISAALLVVLAPVALAFGHILSANALDMPAWLLCTLLLVKIEKGADPRLWLAFGAVAGVALMHKYTLAFFLAALLVGTLLTAWRRWLANRWFWAGVGVALLIVLPNVLWQWQHRFPFLQLQHAHTANHHNAILSPLQFLLAQALLMNFVSAAFAVAGTVLFFTPAMRRFRALGWTIVAFFLLMYALHARDYYLAAIHPIMLAAGAVAAERWLPGRWGARITVAGVALAALLAAVLLPMMVPVLPIEQFARYYHSMPIHRQEAETMEHTDLPDLISDQFGWPERVQAVARYYNALPAEERAKTAILGNFYGQAGAVDHFGPALGLPKAISGHHSYGYWGPRGYTGESIIMLDAWPATLRHCASLTEVPSPLPTPWGRPARRPAMIHCRGLDFNLGERWNEFEHID